MSELVAAEHRALRELSVAARTLEHHWGRLAAHEGAPELLEQGAKLGHELNCAVREYMARYGMPPGPAVRGAGASVAGARGLSDALLERNQALRSALLDVAHAEILLGYLGALARTRDDAVLAEWHAGWETRLADLAARGRLAVAELANDPDGCIEPAEDGWLGRAGQRLNVAIGTLGEAIDARLGRRGT